METQKDRRMTATPDLLARLNLRALGRQHGNTSELLAPAAALQTVRFPTSAVAAASKLGKYRNRTGHDGRSLRGCQERQMLVSLHVVSL